jgi:glycosyltransferase involved in cell wall biosynthesis
VKHLIISREFPPAAYASGGIGTYVAQIARQLAIRGETVHVIAQRSPAAPEEIQRLESGRLVVHRVALDDPIDAAGAPAEWTKTTAVLGDSVLPRFQWHAARVAESLVRSGEVDLVEAQEYEAPACLLQLRRAREGLQVPIVIHLHSPTEFVVAGSGWDTSRSDWLALGRLEEYSIRAADAWISPSRFLAVAVRSRYRLPEPAAVIPYPLGDAEFVERDEATWRSGEVCYVGRLEPRKGVRELVAAAVTLAAETPDFRIALIGGDGSPDGTGRGSLLDELRRTIPPGLHSRIVFVGPVPREELPGRFSRAKLAVVPSRWENFPNTCIEAMASGLPVLASPAGGTAEMIEHGRTGWVAAGCDAASLEVAFRKALATPPIELARMGSAAAASIREQCDNDTIVAKHLEFRHTVAAAGPRGTGEIVLDAMFPPSPSAIQRGAATLGERPLTPLEILRSGPDMRRAVLRRAAAEPGHVLRWLKWHVRRYLERLKSA